MKRRRGRRKATWSLAETRTFDEELYSHLRLAFHHSVSLRPIPVSFCCCSVWHCPFVQSRRISRWMNYAAVLFFFVCVCVCVSVFVFFSYCCDHLRVLSCHCRSSRCWYRAARINSVKGYRWVFLFFFQFHSIAWREWWATHFPFPTNRSLSFLLFWHVFFSFLLSSFPRMILIDSSLLMAITDSDLRFHSAGWKGLFPLWFSVFFLFLSFSFFLIPRADLWWYARRFPAWPSSVPLAALPVLDCAAKILGFFLSPTGLDVIPLRSTPTEMCFPHLFLHSSNIH